MRNGYDGGAGAGVRVFIQLIKSTSSFACARARADETLTKSIIYDNFQMYKIRLKRNEPQEAHSTLHTKPESQHIFTSGQRYINS